MRWTGARTRTYWRFSRGASNASERLARRTSSAVTSLTSRHGGLAPAHADPHSHPQGHHERSHGLDDYRRARRSPAGRPARADVVEGPPAKPIDLPADDDTTCAYCFA